MIHFWREVSLAAFPCAGKAMDECYALLFESTFSLAQSEPDWASECLASQPPQDAHATVASGLRHFAHQVKAATIAHSDLVSAFTHLYAPHREQSSEWQNPVNVALAGELWFWAAIYLAVGNYEADGYLSFHKAIAKSDATDWSDGDRLHIRLIREAPQRALRTPRAESMAHPILRIARLKYREGSVEQTQVLRFLNAPRRDRQVDHDDVRAEPARDHRSENARAPDRARGSNRDGRGRGFHDHAGADPLRGRG
jgi:hypothetical protein